MTFKHQYMLCIFTLAIIASAYYLFIRKPSIIKNEGFESLENCLIQGYPTEFCKRSPLQACVTNCPIGTFVPKVFNTF